MSKQKPHTFIGDIIKRWYLVLAILPASAQSVLASFGVNMIGSPLIGLSVVVVCLFIAFYLAWRDANIRLQLTIDKPSSKSSLSPSKKFLDADDRITLGNIEDTMYSVHGHTDDSAIRRAMKRGESTDDILNGKCVRCNEPRNQKGGISHG